KFYRTLQTRRYSPQARRFAKIHWALAALFFGLTAYLHAQWYENIVLGYSPRSVRVFQLLGVVLVGLTYFALDGVTRLAARLTAWEAAYRGYRMPVMPVL